MWFSLLSFVLVLAVVICVVLAVVICVVLAVVICVVLAVVVVCVVLAVVVVVCTGSRSCVTLVLYMYAECRSSVCV